MQAQQARDIVLNVVYANLVVSEATMKAAQGPLRIPSKYIASSGRNCV